MKRTPLLITFLIALFVLAACGSRNSSSRNSTGDPVGARVLTPESKLALGTLKLEGTPQAVDSAMAAKLLPLWQLLNQLNTSTSSAPQEVNAVVDQIQATMNPDQIKAINSMKFSQADIASVFQQGRANGSGAATSAVGPVPGAGGSNRGSGDGQNFVFIGGGAPGGGFPDGGFRNNGGTGSSTSGQQNSSQRSQSFTNAASTVLVNQVIRLLEGKIRS